MQAGTELGQLVKVSTVEQVRHLRAITRQEGTYLEETGRKWGLPLGIGDYPKNESRGEGTDLVDGGVDTGPKLGRASRLDPCLAAAPGSHGQRWHCPGGRCVGRIRRVARCLRGRWREPEVMQRAESSESAQVGRLASPWTTGVDQFQRRGDR